MFGATIYRSVFEAEMVTLELTERASEAYDVFMANNKMAQNKKKCLLDNPIDRFKDSVFQITLWHTASSL